MVFLELGQSGRSMRATSARPVIFSRKPATRPSSLATSPCGRSVSLRELAHVLANRPGIFPPLSAAIVWAADPRAGIARVAVVVGGREQCALEPDGARLGGAQRSQDRHRATRNVAAGNRLADELPDGPGWTIRAATSRPATGEIAAALAYQKTGSKWLFQISLADYFVQGQLRAASGSAPRALRLYETLLRDPTNSDWASPAVGIAGGVGHAPSVGVRTLV